MQMNRMSEDTDENGSKNTFKETYIAMVRNFLVILNANIY